MSTSRYKIIDYDAREALTCGQVGIRVGKSSIPGAGSGLFVEKKWKRGHAITEYDGDVIDHESCIWMRSHKMASHIITLHSMSCAISGLKTPVDGRGAGSFVNASLKGITPNARFVSTEKHLLDVPRCKRGGFVRLKRIWVVALRDLDVGEEVVCSYGRCYWRSRARSFAK